MDVDEVGKERPATPKHYGVSSRGSAQPTRILPFKQPAMVIGSGVLGLTRRPTRILRSERWSGPRSRPGSQAFWDYGPALHRGVGAFVMPDPWNTDMTAAPPTSSAVYESGPLWAGRDGDWILHQSQPSGWGPSTDYPCPCPGSCARRSVQFVPVRRPSVPSGRSAPAQVGRPLERSRSRAPYSTSAMAPR